jgi:peptidoglycan/LPS O-acetylase OafA/YrhL
MSPQRALEVIPFAVASESVPAEVAAGEVAPGRVRWRSIDSLRGLAASAVVFYHLWNRFWPGVSTQDRPFALSTHHDVSFWATFIFGFGYLGVDLFFVLSGFCIHLPQARRGYIHGKGSLSVADFASRRARRLFPAYLASLLLTSICLGIFPLAFHVFKHQPFNALTGFGIKDLLISAPFLQQFHPESLKFNGVYWTLIYEVSFYLFYPALLRVTRRFGLLPVALALLLAELTLHFWPVPFPLFFLNRYFEWYLGFVAAEVVVGRGWRPSIKMLTFATPALFALGFFSTCNGTLFPYRDLIFSTAFFGVLISTLTFSGRIAAWHLGHLFMRALEHPVQVLIGSFSYSLYLIHVPMIDVLWNSTQLATKYGIIGGYTAGLLAIACVPLLFPAAYLFYTAFERPFIKSAPARSAV